MNNGPNIKIYQAKSSPLLTIAVILIVVIGISLFFFFGFIALIVAGILAIGTSLYRFFVPKKPDKFKEYDPRTGTITLEKSDYEIIDEDK